ncbi:hypothetical protein [Kocuria aegyptia]
MDIVASENLVAVLLSLAGIVSFPSPTKVKKLKGVATADGLVHRKFHRLAPHQLWVTDITEHPATESKIYCCAVLDAFSRFDRWTVPRQP